MTVTADEWTAKVNEITKRYRETIADNCGREIAATAHAEALAALRALNVPPDFAEHWLEIHPKRSRR